MKEERTRTEWLRPYSTVKGLNPLIAGRWSSRALNKDRAVEDKVMKRLYEAARWAPSAMNRQPWRMMSFSRENPETMEKARQVLNRGNSWALSAPRLLFFLALLKDPQEGTPFTGAEYETGMAAAQMAIQAAQEGLVFHQMAGFNKEEFITTFAVGPDYKPMAAVAIGYPGFIEEVPEHRRSLEKEKRSRLELKEIVFSDGAILS